MRSLIFVLVILANPVDAVAPPGPPPWSCSAFTGCLGDGTCDDVEGGTISFSLSETAVESRFFVEGFRDRQFHAAIFFTLSEAKRFLRKNIDAKEVSMLFIHSDEIADAHGFRLHSANTSDSGKRYISEEYLLVGCNSQR